MLNAEASWKPLEAAISSTIGLHLRNIRNRAITPFQKVLIVNKVLIPGIEYRLQTGEIKKAVLQFWNKRIARSLLRSFGWEHYDGFEKAFFPENLGGLNLANLRDVDLQAKIQSIVILGMNGVDDQTKRVIEASTTGEKGRNTIKTLSSKLSKLKLSIQEIKWKETNPGELSCFLQEKTAQSLPRECNTIKAAYSGSLSRLSAALITSINKQMKPIMEKSKSTLEKLQQGTHSIPKEKYERMTTKPETYVVWTDGSFDPETGVSGSAFLTKADATGEYLAVRTPYSTGKSYIAELYAIWLALKMARLDFNLVILTDSESAINAISKRQKDDRRKTWRKDPASPIIESIIELIRRRKRNNGGTELIHVYSHLLDNNTNERNERKEDKLAEMKKTFGTFWMTALKGNQRVDELAKTSLKNIAISGAILSNRFPYGIRDTETKEVWQTGIRSVIKQRLEKHRAECAKKALERKTGMKIEESNLPILQLKNDTAPSERIFIMKLLWRTLKTKDKMHHRAQVERENRKNGNHSAKLKKWEEDNEETIRKRQELYGNDDDCPMGCGEKETLLHLLTCPMFSPHLHEQMRATVKKYDEGGGCNTQTLWTRCLVDDSNNVAPPSGPQQLTVEATLSGIVPKDLEKHLKSTTYKPNVAKIWIQTELIHRIQERWKIRTKTMMKKWRENKKKEREEQIEKEKGNKEGEEEEVLQMEPKPKNRRQRRRQCREQTSKKRHQETEINKRRTKRRKLTVDEIFQTKYSRKRKLISLTGTQNPSPRTRDPRTPVARVT
jgi:ribonuclease HI